MLVTVYKDRTFNFELKSPPGQRPAQGRRQGREGQRRAEQEQDRQGHHGPVQEAIAKEKGKDMNAFDEDGRRASHRRHRPVDGDHGRRIVSLGLTMLVHEFDDLMDARPFRPFKVYTADGHGILVRGQAYAGTPPRIEPSLSQPQPVGNTSLICISSRASLTCDETRGMATANRDVQADVTQPPPAVLRMPTKPRRLLPH